MASLFLQFARHLEEAYLVKESFAEEFPRQIRKVCHMEQLEAMDREQLKAELKKLEGDLADLEEERQAFLGQTGVHIGVGLLKTRRHQYEREEEALRGRIAIAKRCLEDRGR